ncbi:MAG: ABC transporter ATP-binding protein [Candidatus Omnitrophica bacterium]|nr:ABC transporter ATP-binding protein [Candidatus Omnitrophota bacterium]
MAKLLEVKNLNTGFHHEGRIIPLVDDVSFFIEKQSILGLVGESGSGKTMTALSLTNLLIDRNCRVDNGRVMLEGKEISLSDENCLKEKRGKEIAYIFQEPTTSLNPVMSIREQIEEVLLMHRTDIERKSIKNFIITQLQAVGIHNSEKKISSFPHQLSGGEKQRVMIAMAMVSRPKLIVADEPTTALDVTIQAQILTLLLELKENFGVSILFISHDLNIVGQISDYIAVMYAGQIVEFSKAKELINCPRHPYTIGLFNCLPNRIKHANVKELSTIQGEVPKAGNFPDGCRFHPRCPKKFDRCSKEMPPLISLKEDQEVRCWLY